MAAALALASANAQAECLSLTSGPVVYDVIGCKVLTPEQHFDLAKEKYAWIKDLDPAGKKAFYDTYRGTYLKGKVVKSSATTKGIANEQGALNGDTIYSMIGPPATQCNQVLGKRIAGNLKEVCCEGGGQPPCLLDTSYLIQNMQVIGSAESSAGDQTRTKAKRSKDYQAAEKLFRQKKWKDAVKLYEKARPNDELDVTGFYHLGYSYREMDQCKDAIGPLKIVTEKAQKKQIWADEEGTARKAMFLLARCYAKMNDPQGAVLLLNSYLLEPKKYRSEIKGALNHKDFGWIHTSKEYRDFKEEAQKKLGKS